VAAALALDGDHQQLVACVVGAKTREGGQLAFEFCAGSFPARRSGATAAVPLAGGQTHP